MSSMGSGFTHTKAEGETTQWDDILRAKGITQPSKAELDAAAAAAIAKAAEEVVSTFDPLAGRSVAELDELEEEGGGFDDSRELERYREARLAEMKAATLRNRFGAVYPLARVDFVSEVNDASRDGTWVVIHLHQEHVEDSKLLERALLRLAAAKKDVKCMAAKADACIEGYPDKNVPTLLLYRNGELQGQIITLAELGGKRVSAKILEWVLYKKGVCSTDLEDDPREERAGGGASGAFQRARLAAGGGVGGRGVRQGGVEEEDDD